LINLSYPASALARFAAFDFFAGAICHGGAAAPERPAKPDDAQACPVCALFAAQIVALPLRGDAVALTPPRLVLLPPVRGPPVVVPRTVEPRPYTARGPPETA